MSSSFQLPKAIRDYLGYGNMLPCPKCARKPDFLKENINGEEMWTVYCKGTDHVFRSLRYHSLKDAIMDWNEFIEKETME